MSTFVLTDVSSDVWQESFHVDAKSMGLADDLPWSVTKQRLRGGRRDGVDLIVVDNGALRFSIVPTRGMGLWKGWYDGNRIGWDSPIADGPVHPSLVNLAAAGGLGWLDGFDELLARCGLENNGAPFEVKDTHADGTESHTTFGLHGKIANIPASYVMVQISPEPPHEIVVEGHVQESRLFGPQINMVTQITTVPGSNSVVVRDKFINLKDQPVEMQVLYHWNFGPPFLGPGSRFVAPIRSVTPRDARRKKRLLNTIFTAAPSPDRPSRSISTNCWAHRATTREQPSCSTIRPAIAESSCDFGSISSRRSRSGKIQPVCVTATSRASSPAPITPTHALLKKPAIAS